MAVVTEEDVEVFGRLLALQADRSGISLAACVGVAIHTDDMLGREHALARAAKRGLHFAHRTRDPALAALDTLLDLARLKDLATRAAQHVLAAHRRRDRALQHVGIDELLELGPDRRGGLRRHQDLELTAGLALVEADAAA